MGKIYFRFHLILWSIIKGGIIGKFLYTANSPVATRPKVRHYAIVLIIFAHALHCG